MPEKPPESKDLPATPEIIQEALGSWTTYIVKKQPKDSPKTVTLRHYSAPELVDLNRLAGGLIGDFSIEGLAGLETEIPFAEVYPESAITDPHTPSALLAAELKKRGILPQYFIMHIGLQRATTGFGTLDLFILSQDGQKFAFIVEQRYDSVNLPPRPILFGPARNLKGSLDDSAMRKIENVRESTIFEIETIGTVFDKAVIQLNNAVEEEEEKAS